MPRIHYCTTRPLDAKEDVNLYVQRPEDKTVTAYVQQRDYVMLVGARRTGKTSLIHRLRLQLEHDCIPVFVDLMPFKESGKEWYRHVAGKMLDQLQERIDMNSSERATLLGFASDHIGFSKLLEALAKKAKPTDRILVLADEVGMVPPEMADPLFRALRADYNNRAYSEFYRYIFVFAGVFEPVDLIRSGKGSIFDVAQKVYTTDTDTSGVHQLVALLDPEVSGETVRYIHDWTGGHLYLTQRLCSILDYQGVTTVTKDLVEQAVASILADDDSIMHVKEMLNSDQGARFALRKVLAGKRLGWGNTVARRLHLIGVVKRDHRHNCVIRNRIFKKALAEYFQEVSLAQREGEPISQRMRRRATALIALLALLPVLWFFSDTSDVVQAKLLHKSNEIPIIGLQDSHGTDVEATIYSPRLLDSGQPQTINIAIHSREKPVIELVPRRGSGIVVAQDKTNAYKFAVEWKDTSLGILPVRWVERHQVDVIATMTMTGTQQVTVTTPVFMKTNYLSSVLASLAGGVAAIVAALVVFGENVRKLGKLFAGQDTEREVGNQR